MCGRYPKWQHSPSVEISSKPIQPCTLPRFQLAQLPTPIEKVDRLSRVLGGPGLPVGSNRDRYIGNQVQLLAEWQLQRHLTFSAAYAHFFAENFLKNSTPGKDADYASAWLAFRF